MSDTDSKIITKSVQYAKDFVSFNTLSYHKTENKNNKKEIQNRKTENQKMSFVATQQ